MYNMSVVHYNGTKYTDGSAPDKLGSKLPLSDVHLNIKDHIIY